MRAAAGADLDHLDDRDANGNPAALEEAVGPADLERPRCPRALVFDQADLRRGAAHVERQDLRQVAGRGDLGRQDGTAAGARFHQADREVDGRRWESSCRRPR